MGLLPFVKDRVTFVFYDETGVPNGSLEVDATTSMQHKLHAQVTRHPVAKGASLTDNIRPDPDTLTLECFFTNRTGDIIELGKRYARADFTHAEDAFQKLEDVFRNGFTVSVKTRLKNYENMVIEDIGVPVAVEDGQSVRATVSLTQIRTASALTLQVKAKPTAKGPQKKTGGKPKTAGTKPEKQSVLAHAADASGASKNSTLFKKP